MRRKDGWPWVVGICLVFTVSTLRAEIFSEDWLRERGSHEDEEVVSALYSCFRQGVLDTEGSLDADFGPASELYFSEQLARAVQTLGDAPRLAWCRPWFVEPYLRARHALSGAQGRKNVLSHHHTLATSLALDKEGQIIVLAAQDVGGSRTLDHAKMTQEALWARPVFRALKALGLEKSDQVLLVQAAEVPDLYQFGCNPAHARADEHDTTPERKESEDAFVHYVTTLVHQAQQDFLGDAMAKGLVRLGMAAHAVEDLVLHRGLTQTEHAALAFSSGALAHVGPATPIDPALWDEAVRATSDLLAQAVAQVVPKDVALRQHRGDKPAALSELVPPILGRNEGADFTELRQFWRLGWAQRRERGEYLDPSQAPPAVGPWKYERTLAAILQSLQ